MSGWERAVWLQMASTYVTYGRTRSIFGFNAGVVASTGEGASPARHRVESWTSREGEGMSNPSAISPANPQSARDVSGVWGRRLLVLVLVVLAVQYLCGMALSTRPVGYQGPRYQRGGFTSRYSP